MFEIILVEELVDVEIITFRGILRARIYVDIVIVWGLEAGLAYRYAGKVKEIVFVLGVNHHPCVLRVGSVTAGGDYQEEVIQLILPDFSEVRLSVLLVDKYTV